MAPLILTLYLFQCFAAYWHWVTDNLARNKGYRNFEDKKSTLKDESHLCLSVLVGLPACLEAADSWAEDQASQDLVLLLSSAALPCSSEEGTVPSPSQARISSPDPTNDAFGRSLSQEPWRIKDTRNKQHSPDPDFPRR